MTEHEKMQREKMCIDKPANGVDPQTDAEISNNRTRSNVCIGRCHNIPKEGNFKVVQSMSIPTSLTVSML